MKKLLFTAFALAVLPWVLAWNKPVAAQLDEFAVTSVAPDTDAGPPPKHKPPHPHPIGNKPKGYFKPYAGHPYHGGKYGVWAKHWLGHHHHGHHYLYGVYMGSWQGYTIRVWNERWLYWSPEDYCWYRYDEVLGVYIPLNPDGTDAIDTAAPPPPPPPPSPGTPPGVG